MFDIDKFVAACIQARADDASHKAVREVVREAVSNRPAVIKAFGEPTGAGFQTLHRSDELTVLNFTWAPLMTIMPHNHNMWAVIGIYAGREDNIFWRKNGRNGIVEAAGAKSLMPGDAAALGRDIVHSVTNPIEKMTSAIHVYGGDFFAPGRSEWDPETLEQRPYDIDKTRRLFAQANARFNGELNGA